MTYGSKGFPYLTLAGQFLLKDFALAAAAIAMVAIESGRARPDNTVVRRQVAA